MDERWDDDAAKALVGTPPDTTVFRPAAPGRYSLRSTGETVIDPDFTVTYAVRAPGD